MNESLAVSTRRKIVFLCSGGGGNLRFVHEAIARGWLEGMEISAVLCDRVCAASDFANACGIEQAIVGLGDEDQRDLAQALYRLGPDIVVTTVHRILRPTIVDAYRGKLLNLHYSLLPAFGGVIGMRPVKAALAYGARFTGVTTHHVDESVDGGRPIVQAVIPLRANEAYSDELANVVFRCGCLSLLAAIDAIGQGNTPDTSVRMDVLGRPCQFEGGPIVQSPSVTDESFWRTVANGR